jgi:hypothetical protein
MTKRRGRHSPPPSPHATALGSEDAACGLWTPGARPAHVRPRAAHGHGRATAAARPRPKRTGELVVRALPVRRPCARDTAWTTECSRTSVYTAGATRAPRRRNITKSKPVCRRRKPGCPRCSCSPCNKACTHRSTGSSRNTDSSRSTGSSRNMRRSRRRTTRGCNYLFARTLRGLGL